MTAASEAASQSHGTSWVATGRAFCTALHVILSQSFNHKGNCINRTYFSKEKNVLLKVLNYGVGEMTQDTGRAG